VGMHAHTGGVKELSSSTGEARRVECVVVLVNLNIAEEAFDTSVVVAQVMRGEQTRGTAGEAVGGVWRGRQVGLVEVEAGGTTESQVFVKSSNMHVCRQLLDLGKPRQGSRNSKSQARKGAGTHLHWHSVGMQVCVCVCVCVPGSQYTHADTQMHSRQL
jgi:hypothetical protein